MFLLRLLVLLIIVLVLIWLLRRLFSNSASTTTTAAGDNDAENMRQCKYCGVHVPESDIIIENEQPYCSQEHVDLDQQ